MKRSRVLGVLGVAAGLAGAAAVVPLVASSAAGDYKLPDLVSVAPPVNSAYLIEGTFTSQPGEEGAAGRLLLRFDGYVDNVGDGPLHFQGNPQDRSVTQWAQSATGGAPKALPAADAIPSPGTYPLNNNAEGMDACVGVPAAPPARPGAGPCIIYSSTDSERASDGHNHWHLVGAARYTLWNATGAAQVAPGQKVGFCLYDYARIPGMQSGEQFYGYKGGTDNFCQQYNRGATSLIEGINPGFRDVYESRLAWQWIDVSNVQPGQYRLGNEADPFNRIWEKNESNPIARSTGTVAIPGWVPATPGTVSTPAGTPVAVTLPATKVTGSCKKSPSSDRYAACAGGPYVPADGDRRFVITKAPAKGTLNVAAGQPFSANSVRYTPNAGVASTGDTFSYAVYDGASAYPLNRTSAGVNVAIGSTPQAPAPSVAISGNPSSMDVGTQVQLTSSVAGSQSGVTWTASAGDIGDAGVFTAPAAVPAGGVVTVRAALIADPAVFTEATIRITTPPKPEPQPLPYVPATPAAPTPAPGAGTPAPGAVTPAPGAVTPAPGAVTPAPAQPHRGTITRTTTRVPRRLPRPHLVRMGSRIAVWFVPPANGRVAISVYAGTRRIHACVTKRAVMTRPIVCYARRTSKARNVRVVISERILVTPRTRTHKAVYRTLKVTLRKRAI